MSFVLCFVGFIFCLALVETILLGMLYSFFNHAHVILGISHNFEEYERKFFEVNITLYLLYAAALLLVTVVLLAYGTLLRIKLSPSSMLSEDCKISMSLIRRINLVLLICLSCFSLRILLVTIVAFETISDSRLRGDRLIFSNFTWFSLSAWIPFLIPVSTAKVDSSPRCFVLSLTNFLHLRPQYHTVHISVFL